jgi:hypothetical protein
MGKTGGLGLWQSAFCESSFFAIVQAIVRVVRDCTKKIANAGVSARLVDYSFAGIRFLAPINGFWHCSSNMQSGAGA